ncbi:MAG: amidohydrolase family protein [Vulcanimicrobiaceae bacterium]
MAEARPPLADVLFRGARVLDPDAGELVVQRCVLVRAGRIVAVTDDSARLEAAREVRLREGMTLMAGVIDAHVHVTAATANLPLLEGYSLDEIRAAVEEAEAANRYACGHAYSARAVNRALDCGVRSIEHGNLIDATSIDRFLSRDAFLVPTLVTFDALAKEGLQSGLSAESYAKVGEVLEAGLTALALADAAGVKIVFGTDLIGEMQRHQLEEFSIRGAIQSPAAVIRSATVAAAQLLRMEGQIGVIAPGAHADLLVVEGDPLADLGLLQDPEHRLKAIVQGGRRGAILRCRLGSPTLRQPDRRLVNPEARRALPTSLQLPSLVNFVRQRAVARGLVPTCDDERRRRGLVVAVAMPRRANRRQNLIFNIPMSRRSTSGAEV